MMECGWLCQCADMLFTEIYNDKLAKQMRMNLENAPCGMNWRALAYKLMKSNIQELDDVEGECRRTGRSATEIILTEYIRRNGTVENLINGLNEIHHGILADMIADASKSNMRDSNVNVLHMTSEDIIRELEARNAELSSKVDDLSRLNDELTKKNADIVMELQRKMVDETRLSQEINRLNAEINREKATCEMDTIPQNIQTNDSWERKLQQDGVLIKDVLNNEKYIEYLGVALDDEWQVLTYKLFGDECDAMFNRKITMQTKQRSQSCFQTLLYTYWTRSISTRYNFVQALIEIGRNDLAEYVMNLPVKKIQYAK